MSATWQLVFPLVHATIALTLGSFAFVGSRRAWRRHFNPVDLAMSVAAGVWLLHLGATTLLNFAQGSFPFIHLPAAYVAHVGYQALMVAIEFFLLTSARLTHPRIYYLLGLQSVVGAAALHWQHLGAADPALAYQVWIGANLLAATLLTAAVAYRVYLIPKYQGWLALAGCIIGLGLWFDMAWLADNIQRTAPLSDDFYFAFLLVIWHLVTQRGPGLDLRSRAKDEFPRSTGFEPITGFGAFQENTASAVASERWRIAQDLHDGVGSQIVNILSSLDLSSPQQQAVALALEQCLVDLKMTVDAIDSADDNVPEALGRLRYRVQHSLDKLGISMNWNVQLSDELEAVSGKQAQQVLRIAQECLSNVMRHAHASAVEVVCRVEPDAQQLVLEVRDNGQGIARSKSGQPYGKGLEGMRRRAQQVGGELQISSKAGAGTRVRLTLPLARSQPLAPPSSNWDQVAAL